MLDHKIYTFLKLAKCKSTVRCAEELHITQPAVSQHIKALEQQYQTKLFTKEGRHLILTEKGHHFERLCSRLSILDEQLASEMRHSSHWSVRFGATLSICDALMPYIMPRLISRFKQLQFCIEQQNTQELLERLDNGELDFALVEGNFDHHAYDYRPFYTCKFVGLCSSQSKYRFCRTLSETLPSTLLLRERGSGTREIFENACHVHNMTVDDYADICEIGHIPTILSLAASNVGITFAYEMVARNLLKSGKLLTIPLEDFQLQRELHFICLQGSPRIQLLDRIFDELLKCTPKEI